MGQEALQQTILPLKGKWEALRQRKLNISDLSLVPDHDANNAKDLDEELDMQGRKPNSTKQQLQWPAQWSTCQQREDKHGIHCSKTLEGDVTLEASSSEAGSSAPSCNVSIQEDEMLSWLHYPVDENFEKVYCSELFGDVPNSGIQTFRDFVGNRRTPPTTASNGSLANGNMQLSKPPPNAEAAMALGAERAAGLSSQVGLEAFCKVRTSIQPPVPKWPTTGPTTVEMQDKTSLPSKSMGANFPHFSVPVATASSNFHSVEAPCDAVDQSNAKRVLERSASFIGESLAASQALQRHEIETTQKSSLKKEQPDSLVSAGGSSSCKTKSFEIDNYHRSPPEGRKKHEPEPTITSSSGGSENTTEKSEKVERVVLTAEKRKAIEMTDSLECQSEEVEAESNDLKKSSVRPERSRAAEVHNLSERRRRDRINEKMRALQELIPNSNKTDKASMLDEAIEYLKMLQLQLQMMSMRSGMSIPPMVVSSGVQPLQIPQMPPLPYGMGMGMNIGMNMGMGMGMSMMDTSVRPMQPPAGSTGEVSDPLPQQCSNMVESYNVYLSQQQMQVPLQVVNMDMYNTYMLPLGPQLQQSQHHQQQQQLQLHDQQVQQLNHQQQQSLLQHHSSLNNGFHQ